MRQRTGKSMADDDNDDLNPWGCMLAAAASLLIWWGILFMTGVFK